MYELSTLIIICATFLLAGMVKGVIGLGLPTVILAFLTVTLSLPEAMGLLLLPSLMTNVWQALVGGHAKEVIRRIWLFLLMATLTIGLGAQVLKMLDVSWLSALLGLLIMAYGLINLFGVRITVSDNKEKWAGPLFGVVNGVLTGMTGSFVVLGVMYLQAIGLTRNQLIQAMGMLFSLSSVALGIALQGTGLLNVEILQGSAIGLVPAIVGMVLGQKLRMSLSEIMFKRVFFVSLLVLGVYIMFNALWN